MPQNELLDLSCNKKRLDVDQEQVKLINYFQNI